MPCLDRDFIELSLLVLGIKMVGFIEGAYLLPRHI